MPRYIFSISIVLSAYTLIHAQSWYEPTISDRTFLQSELEWTDIGGERATWFLEKDSLGFLWFNSKNGLARYDGVNYNYYQADKRKNSLIRGQVRCVAFEESKHQMWLGYENHGLQHFHLLSQQCEDYRHNPKDSSSLASNSVTALLSDSDNKMWAITDNHVLHRHDDEHHSFQRFALPYPKKYHGKSRDRIPGTMIQDKFYPNSIWIASKFGLFKFDKSKQEFTHYDIDNYVESYNFQFPTPIYQDESGLLWYGHFRNEGVKIFDPAKEKWIHTITTTSDISSFTLDIIPYGDSLILATLRPEHLMVINKYDPADYWIQKLESPAMSSLLEVDDKLNIYSLSGLASIAKAYRSPSYFRFFNFHSETHQDEFWPFTFNYDSIQHIYILGGRRGEGLCITNEKFEQLKCIPFQPSERSTINGIHNSPETGMIWLATSQGISYYKKGTGQILSYDKGYEKKTSFQHIEAKNNKLIFISDKRIVKIDKLTLGTSYLDISTSFPKQFKILCAEPIDSSRIIIGSKSGLWIADMQNQRIDSLLPHKKWESYDLSNLIIYDIAKTDSLLYIGSNYNGTYEAKIDKGKLVEIKNYYNNTTPQANNIYAMTLKGNRLWQAGRNGVQFLDLKSKQFISFDYKDGIQHSWRRMALYQGHGDLVFMPFSNQFYYYHPNEIKISNLLPFLNSIRVNDVIIPTDSINNSFFHKSFESHQKDFQFEFGALNMGIQNKNFYRYRLYNQDTTWHYLGQDNNVNLMNLPSGKHHLQYEVKSPQSLWIRSDYHFRIKKPLLLRWWFLVIWGLIGISILWLAYQLVLARQKRKQKMLLLQQKKAEAELVAFKTQMNPHFLFNTLNSINWYILKNDPKKSSKYLTKFSRVMRDILENSMENLISLKRELKSLQLFVEIESMRFENKFDYQVELAPDIDPNSCFVPPLILQPFVENAIWHGLLQKQGKGKLIVKLFLNNKQLECAIIDDGIGRQNNIKPKKDQSSLGIEIARKRIRALDYSLTQPIRIIDLKDKNGVQAGTEVRLIIPYITS